MLALIAREFNYSETTFVYPPSDRRSTRRVRIFTPGGEIPFAGHPTLGTAHVLAVLGEIALSGETTRITFEEAVGPIRVTIRSAGGVPVFEQLSVAKLPEVGPPPPPRGQLAQVLSLDVSDLLEGVWSPEAVSCGVPILFVPLRDRAAVARARIRLDAWEAYCRGQWAEAVFVFSRDAALPGSNIRARMFAPSFGILEDPATGGACVALGGYLAARDSQEGGTLRWRVEQGFEMKRPSLLDIEVDTRDRVITDVRVGGQSVVVCEGTMRVP